MDWIQILRVLLFGFACAIPFVWTRRYATRLLLCIIAPLVVKWWGMWGIAGWSAYQYIDSSALFFLFILVFGGFCAAHMKFLWSGWSSCKERGISLTDPLKNLSVVVGLLLSMASAFSATYLIMLATSGFWVDAYFPTVTAAIVILICAAWRCRLNTAAFIWASAFGGYGGSLVATWHSDWDMAVATARLGHYHVALSMLMLPEHFIFAVGGALAALLMLGLARAYVALLN
jgi:hypothetical protein